METLDGAVPCVCGRRPRLVQTGWKYGGAWDGGCLLFYELRCSRSLFKCLRVKKSVSKSSPWWRWQEDLVDEWNAAVSAESIRGVSYGC